MASKFKVSFETVCFLCVLMTVSCIEHGCNDVIDRLAMMEDKIQALTETVHTQNAIIKSQGNVNERLEFEVQKQREEILALKENNSAEGNNGGKSHKVEKRQEDPYAVAFTAYVSNNPSHLGAGQPIPYDAVVTNVGNAYNNHTHTFTCPTAGIYLFTFTISHWNVLQVWAFLEKDGEKVVDAIVDPFHGGQDEQSGTTAVLKLNKGQSVWVVTQNTYEVDIHSHHGYRFSSFSGVLITPM